MQEVDLGNELKYKIKYGGTEYVLSAASVQEIMDLQSVSEDKEVLGKTLDFLEAKGMPREVTGSMQLAHLEKLVSLLAGEKKA